MNSISTTIKQHFILSDKHSFLKQGWLMMRWFWRMSTKFVANYLALTQLFLIEPQKKFSEFDNRVIFWKW